MSLLFLVLKAAGGRPDGGANSFAQDSDFDLFYVRDLQSVVGKNGKEPDTPVPSLFVEDIDSSYIGYEDCKTFNQHKSFNKILFIALALFFTGLQSLSAYQNSL